MLRSEQVVLGHRRCVFFLRMPCGTAEWQVASSAPAVQVGKKSPAILPVHCGGAPKLSWHSPNHAGVLGLVDVVDSATRSRMMAGIRSKDTLPEMRVRQYLHATGMRFRLHDRELPGRPDIVLPKHGVAIFIHGCFWHRHQGCRYATTPSSNVAFWQHKFTSNVQRDTRKEELLRSHGWTPLVVWECETRSEEGLDNVFWTVLALSRDNA